MPDFNYENGDKYSGDMKGNKRHGSGTYTDADGHKFSGNWVDDNLLGKGTYTGAEGQYEGDWQNSLKHGKGAFTWTNGEKYVGEWAEDNMNGTGQFYWTNGKIYDGQWCDGLRNGVGILKFPNGSKYEGQWKNDKCHGKGRFTEDNGVYEGDWVENKKHGHGIYSYKDGRKYDGEWVQDKKTKGFVYTPEGEVFKVTFNEAGEVVEQDDAKPEELPGYVAPPKGQPPPKPVAPRPKIEEEEIYQKVRRVEMKQAIDDEKPWTKVPTGGWTYTQKIPYAELKIPSRWNRPDIDVLNRELYLTDDEFKKVFKMEAAVWKMLPQWKRNGKKKDLKLF